MATAARPQTPGQDTYSVPLASDPGLLSRGYGSVRSASRPSSYIGNGSALHYGVDQSIAHNHQSREDFDAASRRSSVVPDSATSGLQRSVSQMSQTPSRSGTLRKKADQHNELMAEKDRTAQVRIQPQILQLCRALTNLFLSF